MQIYTDCLFDYVIQKEPTPIKPNVKGIYVEQHYPTPRNNVEFALYHDMFNFFLESHKLFVLIIRWNFCIIHSTSKARHQAI